MTAPGRIKQNEITRGFKAAKAAGYNRVRVTIDVLGNLVIDASDEPVALTNVNPLDRLLGPK